MVTLKRTAGVGIIEEVALECRLEDGAPICQEASWRKRAVNRGNQQYKGPH